MVLQCSSYFLLNRKLIALSLWCTVKMCFFFSFHYKSFLLCKHFVCGRYVRIFLLKMIVLMKCNLAWYYFSSKMWKGKLWSSVKVKNHYWTVFVEKESCKACDLLLQWGQSKCSDDPFLHFFTQLFFHNGSPVCWRQSWSWSWQNSQYFVLKASCQILHMGK